MNYIVLDLEWNYPRDNDPAPKGPFCLESEIIEIGAVKLDSGFQQISEFRSFVHPVFYPTLKGMIHRLTGISQTQLNRAADFPDVYREFLNWCGPNFCFVTWGPNDLPVLMDNMLIHGMDLTSIPLCYDAQRMFGHEITRDDSQWSLENAMMTLRMRGGRAHDALNDAKATACIFAFMEPTAYLDECRTCYINYGEDRLNPELNGLLITDFRQAFANSAVNSFLCPWSGETVCVTEWVNAGNGRVFGYGSNSRGDEFCVVLRSRRVEGKTRTLTRTILEMSDDLWDIYQTKLEQAAVS